MKPDSVIMLAPGGVHTAPPTGSLSAVRSWSLAQRSRLLVLRLRWPSYGHCGKGEVIQACSELSSSLRYSIHCRVFAERQVLRIQMDKGFKEDTSIIE